MKAFQDKHIQDEQGGKGEGVKFSGLPPIILSCLPYKKHPAEEEKPPVKF
jgi:hypothetical protein